MKPDNLRNLLEAVRSGGMSVERALNCLRQMPFEDVDFAKIDHHRALRCGFPEVIYSPGKREDQIAAIFARIAETGGMALATRATSGQFEAVRRKVPEAVYHDPSSCITYRRSPPSERSEGVIALLAAGTGDAPVIDEARVTCEMMDQRTASIHDVGVAGIHRLLPEMERLRTARVIVVAAGMDGALPAVVSGLVQAPVIAVPTSVGYGAHFHGLAPLLTMLNACAPGVCVVNIDNGFAAGYLAAIINRMCERDT